LPSDPRRALEPDTHGATQYYGDTSWEVSVPDKYLKFANRGWAHHPGYEGSDYNVDIDRGGYHADYVKVWDVGPWNEDDNYTATPTPRRMFTDLPTCTPEAEAAYYDDYPRRPPRFPHLWPGQNPPPALT
jgi:hypothetical protein